MLNTNEIIATAEAATGLQASLEPQVRTGLNTLVQSLNDEALLNDKGLQSMRGILVSNLANRLQVEDYLLQHSHLLQRPIEKPTFVFGLPRTGTTLAINLLNADPARRCLLRWEVLTPVPPARGGELRSDPRCRKEQEKLDWSVKHMPHISAMHHEDADSPAECQFAMSQSFCAQLFEANARLPTYRNWLLYEADYLPTFAYHKRLLQLLQAENTGRWTLKNPWHPLFLDALTTVYPDAQLVMTHRDPVDVVGSGCSLIKSVRELFSDNVDTHSIGASMMDTFEEMIRRTLAFKEKHGEESIYDLQYFDLTRDPVGAMKKLYSHFIESWSGEAEGAMKALLADNPKGKFGKHEYSLEEYGLNKQQVRERFSSYCEKFGILLRD